MYLALQDYKIRVREMSCTSDLTLMLHSYGAEHMLTPDNVCTLVNQHHLAVISVISFV